jgi:uncharacterized protein YabN with tetrapyrrole methylase and pyrophosphatase domain
MIPGWERAQRMQSRAAAEGFDWPDLEGVFAKLREEVEELAEAARSGDAQGSTRCKEELGDVLFVLARLAQRLELDADAALESACSRFDRRFAYVMQEDGELPPQGDPTRLDAMERRWRAAKRREG